MSPTFGSLFAGIGGLDLGLERAGWRCAWQVEIDPYCRRVLAKHWPTVARYEDVRHVGAANLARVDLVAGGFPCQDISYAGRGAGLDGARSGLFYELARVVRELGPRYVLLENVAALLGRGLDAVLGTLASLGYDAEWHCLPAAAVGAPHMRDRVFLVAYTRGQQHQGGCATEQREAAEVVSVADAEVNGREPRWAGDAAQGPRGRDLDGGGVTAHVADADGPRLALRPLFRDHLARQLAATVRTGGAGCEQWRTEPDVGRVADGVPARVDRLRGLGNAVVPQVAEVIGRALYAAAVGKPA